MTLRSMNLTMFGVEKAESKRSVTNDRPTNVQQSKKKVLKLKSPASEGKYDASGASTFRATGDHFWIAVAYLCKKHANSFY
jgi:hypothetical protein